MVKMHSLIAFYQRHSFLLGTFCKAQQQPILIPKTNSMHAKHSHAQMYFPEIYRPQSALLGNIGASKQASR